jgi:hypothetical protein
VLELDVAESLTRDRPGHHSPVFPTVLAWIQEFDIRNLMEGFDQTIGAAI